MKRGRPRKGDTSERCSAVLTLRMPPSELEAVRGLAAARGIPLVKAVREALADYAANDSTTDDAPSSRTVPIPILSQTAK